jgi:ATP-dependent DNA helicase RecG
VGDPLADRLASVVGGRTASALARGLDLHTVGDLLRHYPRRYAERGELTDLGALAVGESVTVFAEVVEVTRRPMRQRRGSLLEATISDGRHRLSLTFFNQAWRERELVVGRRGLFSGQVGVFRGSRQLSHPEMLLLPLGVDADPEATAAFAGALIPIYPATGSVSSWQIQSCVRLALDHAGEVPDPLPEPVLLRRGLPPLTQALREVHQPATREEAEAARHRLAFEEAFTLQVVLAQRRREIAALPAIRRAPDRRPLLEAFDARLPFTLTAGQAQVGRRIDDALAADHPMHLLLHGEVGSGKTLVALRAMLTVVDAGGQAALLAPTEVLAAQHHRSLNALLGPLALGGQLGAAEHATRVALLTGSLPAARRRRALLDLVTGEAGIVVGTHALIQEGVDFHDLALVVVDEQHRFGVEQRAALAAKAPDGSRPHVLVMTATPIPRTIAMTVFGDIEVATLTELPAHRAGITTHVVAASEQPRLVARTWERVREEAAAGHRVFVVCPRIGEDAGDDTDGADLVPEEGEGDGEAARAAGVVPLARELAEGPLAGLRLGILHGRLPAEEKDEAMRRFAGDDPDALDVLVATTVVEVGVDVPRATVMVVMDADRFGVSQLHQLRGRVGRGDLPGLCLLVTSAPAGTPARERLDAVAGTTDGFALSELDLQLRREGDVLGSQQSGRRSSLRLLEVARHGDLIAAARDEAALVVADDPDLAGAPVLRSVVGDLRADEHADFLEKA